jgi:hypothetical protein
VSFEIPSMRDFAAPNSTRYDFTRLADLMPALQAVIRRPDAGTSYVAEQRRKLSPVPS